MAGETTLVIEDDCMVSSLLQTFLKSEGYRVTSASDGEEGIGLIREESFDIVITDQKMPGASGLDVLEEIKNRNSDSIGIVMTGFGSIESAVRAMQLGAFDYITKPLNLDELRMILKRALEHRGLQRENFLLRKQLKAKYQFKNFVGNSEEMLKVFRIVEKIADTDSTVLIYGESGTGKELVAKSIHYNSERRERLFVPVNCAAIPENLLESELFGHEKGSFTGATRTQIGRFEKANGGTIFLDEVGDMSPTLQTKILRVLQEREFERVGGPRTIKVDVRVIAATHRDLEEEIKKGTFREDLYYRLNVIPIVVPPLRERRSDIPILVNHFLKRLTEEKGYQVNGIDREAMEILSNYHWPGNVRELENLMERMVILKGKGVITRHDLPSNITTLSLKDDDIRLTLPETGIDLNMAVSKLERELIIQALNKSNWVKNKAAQMLQIKRTTLLEKMRKNNISKELLFSS